MNIVAPLPKSGLLRETQRLFNLSSDTRHNWGWHKPAHATIGGGQEPADAIANANAIAIAIAD